MAKALTDASVEKVNPNPKRRLEIPDALLPGFYLLVQPSGAKSWAVRYRRAGKPRKFTLGTYPRLDLKTARGEARKALVDVQRGTDPAVEKKLQQRKAAEGKNSFEAVARTFIDQYQRPRNRSWKESARLL